MRIRSSQSGFSLLEMIVVMAVTLGILTVLFNGLNKMSLRATTEDNKVDVAQSAREFLDQITRDLHQAGYPNRRTVNLNAALNANLLASGITTMTATQLDFEGDLEADGSVELVSYRLLANNGTCPCALQRSVRIKGDGSLPVYYDIVSDVINSNNTFPIAGSSRKGYNDTVYSTMKAAPIFVAYDGAGALTNVAANVRAIRVNLNMFSQAVDLENGVRPVISMSGTARLNNITY